MAALDKKAQLEERKKKWMMERDISSLKSEVLGEMRSTSQEVVAVKSNYKHANNFSAPTSSSSVATTDTDAFLNKLTDKLTAHIRNEIRKEMMDSVDSQGGRVAIAEKIDDYMQTELSSHTCKICFEVMTSPVHTPILLFPCGHTFCKACIEQHLSAADPSRRVNKGCPYCRLNIIN
jgi:hypothetical protein